MNEDSGKRRALVFNTIQFILFITAIAAIGLTFAFKTPEPAYFAIGFLLLVLCINIIRRALGLNLFGIPRESPHQTIMLLFQFVGLAGLITIWYRYYVTGTVMVVLAIAFVNSTRYGLWHLFDEAKKLNRNELRKELSKFSIAFLIILVTIFIITLTDMSFMVFIPDVIIAWSIASLITGFKITLLVRNKMITELEREAKSTRTKFATFILRMFSFGNVPGNQDISPSIRIFSTLCVTIAATITGCLLPLYYTYVYINK